jgi:hypothetical protein
VAAALNCNTQTRAIRLTPVCATCEIERSCNVPHATVEHSTYDHLYTCIVALTAKGHQTQNSSSNEACTMCTGIALRALEASGVNVTLSVCGALVRSLVASPVACNVARRMLHVA